MYDINDYGDFEKAVHAILHELPKKIQAKFSNLPVSEVALTKREYDVVCKKAKQWMNGMNCGKQVEHREEDWEPDAICDDCGDIVAGGLYEWDYDPDSGALCENCFDKRLEDYNE